MWTGQSSQLNHLGTGEFAVGFLFENHLSFGDIYGSENVHYPLNTESAATFHEKIAQLRNDLSTFVHASLHYSYCSVTKELNGGASA